MIVSPEYYLSQLSKERLSVLNNTESTVCTIVKREGMYKVQVKILDC